ncbi:hypothetical protein CVIRNUC_001138 [Coccomyxa viridis]|uniref:SigF-like NTF2-like domain-containing protein n=1 Tax=Coccomyxa viridis TaxID=1274662 RepID=A0AAV1HTS3_9CHLO|nr:hypothetical protein CVIRNUC_001138 [Coccomyxa viridis]
MDIPEKDLPTVARVLIQGSPDEQYSLIDRLFTDDSSFSHPFVDCMGKDEIAAAYDYWVHSHRKVDFTYKDTKFEEGQSCLLIFDFTARFWPYWWPFSRHAYALHYDIEVDLRKYTSRYKVIRQDDTLRLLDSTHELPILGWIIGDESSMIRRGITKIVITYQRLMNTISIRPIISQSKTNQHACAKR